MQYCYSAWAGRRLAEPAQTGRDRAPANLAKAKRRSGRLEAVLNTTEKSNQPLKYQRYNRHNNDFGAGPQLDLATLPDWAAVGKPGSEVGLGEAGK